MHSLLQYYVHRNTIEMVVKTQSAIPIFLGKFEQQAYSVLSPETSKFTELEKLASMKLQQKAKLVFINVE